MSSQVLAAPVVGDDLSRRTETRSPAISEALLSPKLLNSTLDKQHLLPEQPNTRPSFLSHAQLTTSDAVTLQQPDQVTFEQTQRAVGNLLDALRTNNAQSHVMRDAIAQSFSELPEKGLQTPDLQRPSVSPIEPQSPDVSAPTSTGFTFPGAEALDNSIGVLPVDGLTAHAKGLSESTDVMDLPTLAPLLVPQQESTLEEPIAETVEEELPLNVQNAQDTGQISAFAKLEFDDGPFYITTQSLELGRDARAYRVAKARLAEQEAQQAQQNGEVSSSANSQPSSQSKRDGGSQVKGSVISDRGGFYGVDDVEAEAQEADEERQRQRVNGSHSSNHSASSIVNPKDLYTRPPLPHFNYQAYPIEVYEREIEEISAPVKLEELAEQEEGFLLPIHHASVKDDIEQDVANHRSVSRRHAKIFWEEDCFKFHVKGVNGVFVNEVHYPKGAIVPLREDVSIQIKGIKFQFKLPVHHSIESSEDSDQAEDDSPNQNAESSSATSGVEGTVSPHATTKSPLKVKIRNFSRASPPPPQPALGPDGKPKRRGPGRPPKDGIMSKRERIAKERADRDAAAKAANGGVTPEPSSRGRSGRTMAKTAAEPEESKPAKRKYTKRKSANQDPDDATPKLEDDSEGAVDDAPPTKRARVSRSESPEYPKLEDLSEKDLQRPPYNYSILIYDLLKDSPKPLDLKGIYRGLKMKWPHFLHRYKDAKGWESSVRHNVNEDKLKIIEKVDRVGKGYSYRAKPGVDIEQHKKKRARSPPPAPKMSAPPQQRYQQHPQPPPPGSYPYSHGHQPPPGHGMYGHLVPTTVPQSSMSYTMSYPPATAGPYSSGATGHVLHYATSAPLPQQMAYTTTTGSQSIPATTSAGPYSPHVTAYPTPPAPNLVRPGPYNNPQPPPARPPIANPYPTNHQHPSPAAPHQFPKQQQQAIIPPPPLGVSPYQPFLPDGLSVISTFESSLLEGVENPTDLPRIRATLASVRKRVFEGANVSSLPGGETQDEKTFLHYFNAILQNEKFRNPGFVGWEAVMKEKERYARMQQQSQGGIGGRGAGEQRMSPYVVSSGRQAQAQATDSAPMASREGSGGREEEGDGDEDEDEANNREKDGNEKEAEIEAAENPDKRRDDAEEHIKEEDVGPTEQGDSMSRKEQDQEPKKETEPGS
jgi:Forkhead domain/FHA domain